MIRAPTILVVHDYAIVRVALRKWFADRFIVRMADGRSALHMAEELADAPLACIVLDWIMPAPLGGSDSGGGYALACALRRLPAAKRVPLVVCSAVDMPPSAAPGRGLVDAWVRRGDVLGLVGRVEELAGAYLESLAPD